MGIHDIIQTKHAIKRNFPIVGRLRYLFEMIRPEINQYFIESNTDGVPFSRENRSIVYQRSKKQTDTIPFGTKHNVYADDYEFLSHSIAPTHLDARDFRVEVGGKDCQKKYSASIFNISAMSYGSLSNNAVLALNGGAKDGAFAHNTGEGGISSWHMKNGGDLIWQIGTGYFGCRTHEGNFDEELFKMNSSLEEVKMIEIKISQGAKPGHGGILPKEKVTQEIAEIRNVPLGKDVISPPGHKEFDTPKGLLHFIVKLRKLSGGKPVGIKLCIGKKEEFISLCKAMVELEVYPDYIAIDGGEGGTGAAPLEFSNHLGMPGLDGVLFVINTLRGFDLKDKIKLMASGKLTSAFGLIKLMCLGVDALYAARPFMLSLGCIQALRCNTNDCPTGVATQDKRLIRGLSPVAKRVRVKNFHEDTLKHVAEILGAMGVSSHEELNSHMIFKRRDDGAIKSFAQIYPTVEVGSYLKEIPKEFAHNWERISSDQFALI